MSPIKGFGIKPTQRVIIRHGENKGMSIKLLKHMLNVGINAPQDHGKRGKRKGKRFSR